MSLHEKSEEIHRLLVAFEREAGKFHDLQFHVFHVTQDGTSLERKFASQNHAIMLWQYYGTVGAGEDSRQFISDLNESELQWGIRGAAVTLNGVIEGEACRLFTRMAIRAGSLFSEDEAWFIKSRIVSEIQQSAKATYPSAKPTAIINDNPLAIWLNFLLYHLSMTNPSREHASKIDPDPFSLSLLALERLDLDRVVGKADRSKRSLTDLKFKVAMSFPGEKRRFVSRVVTALRGPLGNDSVFYDFDYQAQLARPNLDLLLQRIYRDQSELIVVFLCAQYATKQWCGLEWRAVRDIIKSKEDERIMFVRFDNAAVDGVFSIDGYVDGGSVSTKQVAELILSRLSEIDVMR